MLKITNSTVKMYGKTHFVNNENPVIPNQLGSYYYTGTLISGTTVLYSDSGLTTVASAGNFIDASTLYTIGAGGVVTSEPINTLGSYYYTGTLTSGTTVLYSDSGLTTQANVGETYIEASTLYTIGNGGVVTSEPINTLGSYYHVGTLISGTTVLYSDDALTTVASAGNFIDASTLYTIDNGGVVTSEPINTLGSYYYAGTLTSGTTVLYSDSGLTTQANPGETYIDASTLYTIGAGGVVTSEPINTLGSYYYAGTLTSGTTVLYSDSGLTTLEVNLPSTNVGDLDSDGLDDYITTDNSGTVTINYGTAGASTVNLPYADGADGPSTTYYYSNEDTFETGTVLYTDDTLQNTANDLFLVNESSDILYKTNASGVLTISDIEELVINGITYYYEAPLVSEQTIVYLNNALTTTSGAVSPYTVAGVAVYSVSVIGGLGVITVEPINTATYNGYTYYYIGPFTTGTYVYSNDALTNPGALGYTDPGVAIYQTNYETGLLTVTNINILTLDGEDMYYTGTLTSGTTVLYTDNVLTLIRPNLYYTDPGVAVHDTDEYGVYFRYDINALGSYYYTGTLTSGSTQLFSDDVLAVYADDITYIDPGINKYTTNNVGVVTIHPIYIISIDNIMYYHTGLFENGTVLYEDNSLDTVKANLPSTQIPDTNNDSVPDFVSTDGAGVVTITLGT